MVLRAVANRSFRGRELVSELVAAARGVLLDFAYTDQLVTDGGAGLVFRARIGAKDATGLDLLRFDQAGLVTELTVLVRPLSAASAFNEAMAAPAAAVLGRLRPA